MLCLSRKVDERIILSGGITIMVLAVDGKHVKLGFEAPKDVVIAREEVWNKRTAKEEDSQ